MLKLTVIGNLGSDAELRTDQGQPFVSLSIAHTEKQKNTDGREYEQTTWVSATINGDGGNLLQYLKKGVKVYAYGDCGLRIYHSEKERKMKAGINLFVRNIELIGARPDEVPHDVYDSDGVAHAVNKFYHCADAAPGTKLYSKQGAEFITADGGWVTPATPEQPKPQENEYQGY